MPQKIHEIDKLKPKDILEIGLGDGFVSSFLKRAGYDVTTVDINPALEPDICAPLDQMSNHLRARSIKAFIEIS
jgi:protein-L-isoaspartate O-methyltransferase